jgi:hypothetical protein
MMDLPAPPPIPSVGAATQPAKVQSILTKAPEPAIAKLPAISTENRVTNLENEFAAMKSKVNAMDASVRNAESIANRPLVEKPMFTEETSKLNTRTWLALSLAVLSAILVIGVMINLSVTRKKAQEKEKNTIREYVTRYKEEGYTPYELKSHLTASGWDPNKIDEALR